jgi:hypothetical protein
VARIHHGAQLTSGEAAQVALEVVRVPEFQQFVSVGIGDPVDLGGDDLCE